MTPRATRNNFAELIGRSMMMMVVVLTCIHINNAAFIPSASTTFKKDATSFLKKSSDSSNTGRFGKSKKEHIGDDKILSPPASSISVTGVTLKIAVDKNWGAAEMKAEESVRFTSSVSLDMVHRLRNSSDAVLVGCNTVLVDDCSLLVRRGILCNKQPIRIILDPNLKTLQEKKNYQVFCDGYQTVVYHCVREKSDTNRDGGDKNTTMLVYMGMNKVQEIEEIKKQKNEENSFLSSQNGQKLDLRGVLEHAKYCYGVNHVMVEGGPATAQQFLKEKLIDRAIVVRALSVAFKDPLDSKISNGVLEKAGLKFLGNSETSNSNHNPDVMDYWCRGNTANNPQKSKSDNVEENGHKISSWPKPVLTDWP